MTNPKDIHPSGRAEDPREIGHWAHAYAQNRSLGFLTMLAIYIAFCLGIGLPSYFGGMAYRAGHWPLFYACIAVLIVAVVATGYMAVPRWGGKLAERITRRLYAGEGRVELTPPCTPRRRWIGGLLGAAFGTCILAAVVLGALGVVPEKYMQPISAIYSVPFLVGLWLIQRPASGPIFLLWPALYALHAVLIVAGAPILFVGPWSGLNMFIPVFGYGLLTGLVSHLYSRVALARLRRSVRSESQDDSTGDAQP